MPTIGSNNSTTSKSVVKERFDLNSKIRRVVYFVVLFILFSWWSLFPIISRFRSFTMQFEEVCQTQINWVVPDRELRENLILAIAEIIIPAYREFLKSFGYLSISQYTLLFFFLKSHIAFLSYCLLLSYRVSQRLFFLIMVCEWQLFSSFFIPMYRFRPFFSLSCCIIYISVGFSLTVL
jgi:hypothetical protein